MIADVRDTFIRNIDHLDWMDDKTKAYAREKVNRLLSGQSIFLTADDPRFITLARHLKIPWPVPYKFMTLLVVLNVKLPLGLLSMKIWHQTSC